MALYRKLYIIRDIVIYIIIKDYINYIIILPPFANNYTNTLKGDLSLNTILALN
jgi:hypothetical protein